MAYHKPRYPIYIPSVGRSQYSLTMKALCYKMGIEDFYIITEHAERDLYASKWGHRRVLILPQKFWDDYDPCDDLGQSMSMGPGPARNFAMAHARANGYPYCWTHDDNIRGFYFVHAGTKYDLHDLTGHRAAENIIMRYANLVKIMPEYDTFAPVNNCPIPMRLNNRCMSSQLMVTDGRVYFRGRYNDDVITCLDILKSGNCTATLLFFQQAKLQTQTMPGGCTDRLYFDGTAKKSEMLVRVHPDCCSLVQRYGRVHHKIDYGKFRNNRLIPSAGVPAPEPLQVQTVPRIHAKHYPKSK